MLKTVRWKIGFLMFLGILINYLDRVNISQSIIVIPKSFGLSGLQKGWVLSAFGIGYVLAMMAGGWAVSKLGARKALSASMVLLALASVCCGFSFSFFTLLAFRFLVGIFEAPAYPAFASIAGRWFPKKEQVKAIGFFDTGSYTGIAVATLVIGFIITQFNWRASFMFSGLLTLLWAVTWFWYFRDSPASHPAISPAEVQTITANATRGQHTKVKWVQYLGNRKVIGISIGFFCFNYLKSFYLTWLHTYMVEAKGIKMQSFSLAGSLPVVLAITGEIATATIIDRLVAKGRRPSVVKKTPICLGMMLSTVIVFSLFSTNPVIIIALLTASYIFLVSASAAIWSIPAELSASPNEVAVIGSIQNTFSNIAGIVAPIVTGYFYGQGKSFLMPFVISIAISLIGAGSYWKLAGELKFIEFGAQAGKKQIDNTHGTI